MLLLWEDGETSVLVSRLTEAVETENLICLFEDVAEKENWQPGGAFRLWTAHSVYFSLYRSGALGGGLQLVLPDGLGSLPYQSVWSEVEMSHRTAHIAILALGEEHRGQGILFWRLTVEMWRYCVAHGIATVFIEVTPRILPLYRRLGWPLVVQGGLRVHWGEPCYLCSLGIPEVAEAILRRAEQSAYYREIVAQAFRVDMTVATNKDMRIPTEAMTQ